MKQKRLLITFVVVLSVFFLLLVLITQVLGVPLWYVFGIKKLQIADNPYLLMQVSPESPSNIGERITVTITNSSSGLPVVNVTVHITKDSMNFDKYTDFDGKVTFDYLGEVTVVSATKDGILSSDFSAIPKAPEGWVRNYQASIISAAFGSLLSGLITFMIQRKTAKNTTIRSPRGRKRRS
jgi:hypothetical protein